MLMFYKMGGKQLYYFQTYDGAGEVDVDKMQHDDLPQADLEDEDCDGCTI